MDIIIFAVVQIFMLIGLLGLIVPLFPGTVVMWLAALGYGVAAGFDTVGIVIFILITVLMLVSTLADNIMMAAGGRQGGANWLSIIVAMIAGVIGTFAFPPIGGIIAAPLSVLVLEFIRLRDWKQAWQALRGMATGWGLSLVVRFLIGLIMMILWWIWALA